ncbi:MAG TPA: hypothetical protein P5137_11510, partial [Candidatus Brocadiia bacterium]|nr:hypothetical protein [Candidatus Brocadiia bacterium]
MRCVVALALTAGVALGQGAFTEGYLPQFSRTVKPAARERVTLINDYPPEMSLDEYPVTFGVAFPRGALRSADSARIVTKVGQEVPCQVLRTATWLAPDGDVKWLLFDMTARKGEEYAVEFGSQVRRADAASPMKVTDAAGRIEVSTGPLRVAFDKAQSHLLAGAWLDGKAVLAAGQRMYMVDQNGARYETSDKPADYRVEVEASGLQAVIIKASGWYRDAAGKGLCQYVTRVHLYAGAPFLRVIHTFIVNYDTDKTWLTDVGVPLALAAGPARKATFSADTGFGGKTFDAAPGARLIQTATNNWVIQDAAGKTLAQGKRVGGWVDLATASGGVVVGLRHMWQEHQKELETLPGAVVAHLWPAHSGKAFDLRAPQLYGPERYAALDGVYWQKWYVGGLDKYDQAMGLAKTNEMTVAFYASDPKPARAAAEAQEKPPFVAADPKWMCATDVFGPLWPRDAKKFAEVEAAYDAAFDRFQFLRDHLDNYGCVEYGDVNYVVNYDAQANRFKERPWRRMASRFYGISLMPWIQFIRTGRRDYLAWAVDSAKHVMDIDMCHVDAQVEGYPYPKYKGGRYGGNGGIIHYGADIYDIGCDSHVTPWLYCYYLTGYRRAWDIFLEEGDFNLKLGEPGYRPSGHQSSYAHRMTGGAMRVFIQYWWATWDKRYLDKARKLADLCYDAAKKDNGVIRHDDVYMNAGMVTYYQATGDKRMKEVFLRSMEEVEGGSMTLADPRAYSFYGPAMAYYFTGDARFLARPYYWLMQYVKEVDVGKDPMWRGNPKGKWDMCHNTVHMLYTPYLLGALATLKEPPKPPADPENSATGGEIWMENPDGRAFEVEVKWN